MICSLEIALLLGICFGTITYYIGYYSGKQDMEDEFRANKRKVNKKGGDL